MSARDSSPRQSSWRVLQIRAVVSHNTAIVAGVLLIGALVGGVVTYNAHVDPGTEVQTVQESSWSSTGEYAHQATVREETAVFDRGAVLTNQPAYIETVAPVLNGTFSYRYEASGGGDLSADAAVVVVVRSVSENGFEFWRQEQTLTTRGADSLQPGEQLTVPFSLNVTALSQEIARIESQLGTNPGATEIAVESRLALAGERNGRQVERENTYMMNVVRGDGTYSVSNTEPQENGNEQFRQVRTTASYGLLRGVLGPAAFLVALLGLVAVGAAVARGDLALSESEHQWLAYCMDRSEFDEWVSAGDLLAETKPERRVKMDSLNDLVDVAIDSNRRVIEDESRGLYAVLVEDVAYVYERPDPPAAPMEPLSLLGGGAAGRGRVDDAGDEDSDAEGDASDDQ